MDTGITYYKKKEIETIGSILKKTPIKKKHCTYEWQDRAFEMAEKLNIDFKAERKHLGNWLRLFKDDYTGNKSGKLDNCYSFIVDYNQPLNTEAKIKMFFWRYWHKPTST